MKDKRTLEWFMSLSDDDLKDIALLEAMHVENHLPERTRDLLVVLAKRLESKNEVR